jgi:hypothetical protein
MLKHAILLVAVAGLAGCAAKAQSLTPMPHDGPALVPPTPPARVIVPTPEQPTLPVAVEEPTTAPATRPRETPPPTRPTPPPTTTPPVENAAPPPILSTSANTADFEKRIRQQLAKANGDLGQVKRQALGADARAQYDAALGFIRQAEAALKVRNLMFAGQLADKAATLAELLRREARQ